MIYQWRLQGVNISGATNSTYALAHVTPADGGLYDVIVANSGGIALSSNALVTVRAFDFGDARTLTQPCFPPMAPGMCWSQISFSAKASITKSTAILTLKRSATTPPLRR